MSRLGDPSGAAQAPHRVAIEGGWSLWRDLVVRSAGFPVATLDELGSPATARAIDAALAGSAADRPAAEIARMVEATAAPELERISRALRRSAGDPRFREALLWQNRHALTTAVVPLLGIPPGASNKSARRKEQLVASYLQRYCAKNDTIGFFGPLAWMRLSPKARGVALRAGPALLAGRSTYFEHWAIDLLARSLGADPELRRALPPRRHPVIHQDGLAVWDAQLRRHELPPVYARLLAACDGVRPARAIAEELAADPTLELDGPDEVYELLDELVEQKLLLWTIEISPVPRHPEAALRRALEAASGPACERGLEALRELERGRDAVRAAAGRPAELAGALAELDATFEKVTDHAPVRRDGEFYAGRTLLYELGTRDVELELGGDVLARLGPPLALVLASARWFTWHVGQRYLAAVHAAYRALRDELGDPVVPYLLLWQRIAPLFPNGRTASPIVTDVSDELRRRWMDLLAFDPAERRVQRTAAALRDPVEEAFGDAPGPGWPWARHQSPDLMIAACSAEAIARGEYTVVLGELHSAMHSYLRPLCIEDVPHRDRLIAAYEADIERGCVFPVTSRSAATAMDDASMSRADYELVTGDTPPAAGPARALAVGELCAAEEDGRLVVRTRDGRARLQAAEYLSYYLSAESMSQFKLLPDATHLPRVEIDGLVIARERWTFEADQLTLFRRPAPRLERFVEARRWARTHDLPRRVFVTIPEEIKPTYVDLESPVYVELFSRLIRNASRLTVTEMLPGPDECWLVDASGARYTSELRVAAVDPEPWRPR